jgi:hypothetical protein
MSLFPNEALLMTLILSQQKLIDLLIGQLGSYSDNDNQPKKQKKQKKQKKNKKIYND